MRKFLVGLVVILVVGCKSTPTYLYQGDDSSIVTSDCDKVCTAEVKSLFPDLSFGIYGAKISPVIILSVNNVAGKNTYGGTSKYNGDSWGKYELHLKSGDNILEAEVNNHMAYDKVVKKLELSLNPNERYFVGQVIKIKGEGSYYKWVPIVYSYTQQRILMPSEKVKWLGNI